MALEGKIDAEQPKAANGTGDGFWHAVGSQLVDVDADPVRSTGLNWFGMETSNNTFHGLLARSCQSMIGQVIEQGYNTLRVRYSNDVLRAGVTANSTDFGKNPDLQGLTPVQILNPVIGYAGDKGMRSSGLVMDRERLSPAAEPENASSGSRGVGGLRVLGDRPTGRSNPDDEFARREAMFEAFVERNSRELGRLAYLMVGDRDAADDLTADALLAAWRQWDTVRASDHPLAYVRRVVINMAATRVRRLVRERRWLVMFQSDATEVVPGPDSAAVVDVRLALQQLPAGRRACVVLRYAFDLSEQEVSAVLGVSVGTVKSQTSKGSEQLRRRLGAPDETITGSLADPVARRTRGERSGVEGRKDG